MSMVRIHGHVCVAIHAQYNVSRLFESLVGGLGLTLLTGWSVHCRGLQKLYFVGGVSGCCGVRGGM